MNDWRSALDGFESDLVSSQRAAATIETYVKHAGWLRDGTVPGPWEITTTEVSAWLDGQNWSKQTRRKVLGSLRAFYVWAINNDLCETSPLAGLSDVTSKSRGPNRTQPTRLWVKPIELFLRHLEAGGRAPGTVEMYRLRLTNVSHSFRDPWRTTTGDLENYLSRPDWAAETKRHARSTMRGFYTWAMRAGYVDESPARDLQTVRRNRHLPRPTPTDSILDALTRSDGRTRLAIELAMYAGLRRGEIAQLRVDNISDDQVLIHGKGGVHRIVPLHRELKVSLRAELSRRDQAGITSPWLFPSSHGGHLTPHHLGKLVRRCFEGSWTTHSLRHRFATQAYAATYDLRAVQELLGHAKPETTAIYTMVPNGARAAAVAGVGL